MYRAFLNQNKNKKKETKHANLRSTSSRSSIPPSVSPYVSSSSGPINAFRSTSQPSAHWPPWHSEAQSSLTSCSTDHPSSLSHTFPHPINSPLPNADDYSRYSYLRTDQQLSPLVQGYYSQHNHEQQYQKSCVSPSPQQASVVGSPLSNLSACVNHRSKQYGSSCINERLQAVAAKYKIRDTLTRRLYMLEQFEIVVLCDDSGSMNAPIDTNNTRWNELQTIVQIIIEISVVLDSNGIDVYFLNRDAVLNVTDPRQIYKSFAKGPFGATPLVPALRQIFRSAASKRSRNKSLLVFVATDGEPTDASGNVDIRSLERLMQTERQSDSMHVTFLTCTDNKASVAYLSEWDRTMINVDVIDNYETEREEVRRMQGLQVPFSFGDYIAKALLGAVDPQMDMLDEPTNNNYYNRS